MATIPFKQLTTALESGLNRPKWHWVIDGEDTIYADKDHPPTHELSGHWEYVKTIKEVYADAAPFYNDLQRKKKKQS